MHELGRVEVPCEARINADNPGGNPGYGRTAVCRAQSENSIFTGCNYDYLLPHAEQVKVAHPLMLRAIAAAKKKNANQAEVSPI